MYFNSTIDLKVKRFFSYGFIEVTGNLFYNQEICYLNL